MRTYRARIRDHCFQYGDLHDGPCTGIMCSFTRKHTPEGGRDVWAVVPVSIKGNYAVCEVFSIEKNRTDCLGRVMSRWRDGELRHYVQLPLDMEIVGEDSSD